MKRLATLVRDDNLDLYLLAVVALVFTVLGSVGLADTSVLISVTLAVLALLAFSQIKSRKQVAAVAAEAGLLRDDFPADLPARRAGARDFLFIGRSMARTANTMRGDLRRMLAAGARVRVLVVDPGDEVMVASSARHSGADVDPALLAGRIRSVLAELAHLRETTGGDLQIRVAGFVPSIGVNAIDTATPGGLICVQHFEHRPEIESGPILTLRPHDGLWYQRFAAEAERMWNDGTPWPE
ncbi:hypothetical protein [Herbidospora mongoliensis]|uniref:hypothetical protein n=1 Tax=Herbidospora mongoliensis TaxID=688067 RepID=UPI000A87A0A7|nr:hypothetical protein [Herbidospora mongoliensis]